MRVYDAAGHGPDFNVTGMRESSILKIARVSTTRVLPGETYHSHPKATEYYLMDSGIMRVRIGPQLVTITEGKVLEVGPGEKHGIEEVVGHADYWVINTETDPLDKIVEPWPIRHPNK